MSKGLSEAKFRVLGRSDRLQGCDAAIETLAQGKTTLVPGNDDKAKERSESGK
jgi:hypothetical protein